MSSFRDDIIELQNLSTTSGVKAFLKQCPKRWCISCQTWIIRELWAFSRSWTPQFPWPNKIKINERRAVGELSNIHAKMTGSCEAINILQACWSPTRRKRSNQLPLARTGGLKSGPTLCAYVRVEEDKVVTTEDCQTLDVCFRLTDGIEACEDEILVIY